MNRDIYAPSQTTSRWSTTHDGPFVKSTNFWQSDFAALGAPALSVREGHGNLLLPDAAVDIGFCLMPATCLIAISGGITHDGTVHLAFLNGDVPIHGLALAPSMVSESSGFGPSGSFAPFHIYGQSCDDVFDTGVQLIVTLPMLVLDASLYPVPERPMLDALRSPFSRSTAVC